MRVIVGAGAVGLVMGARMERAGDPVVFLTRRSEVADLIERDGIRIEDAMNEETFEVRTRATADPEAAVSLADGGEILFCVRGSQVGGVAESLARFALSATAVCWQNDVASEDVLAQQFPRVIGGVVRLTSTRTAPNAAIAAGTGRLVVGDYPSGASAAAHDLAEALRRARYDVGVSTEISRDKWLKLCINLMSAPNALIRKADHTTEAFVEIKARLLEEARDALFAEGIDAASCDGHDRTLEDEIVLQRESHHRGTSTRSIPVFNQVWAALMHGGPLEADGYHRRILALCGRHGIAAPINRRVLEALDRAVETRLGPESMGADELLGDD
ncbi:MAG: hypothetical protein HRU01_18120 [Myxococcales bacterium]|nr:hypothetical protein [Myxococcales bacterium]